MLGSIYPVYRLEKMLCPCFFGFLGFFFYSVSSEILWQECSRQLLKLLCSRGINASWLLLTDFTGTGAPQVTRATVCCAIDYLIAVVLALCRQQFVFHERVGLVASRRAFSLGQSLVCGKLADILGALAVLKEVSYQWEPRDCSTWRQECKIHMGGNMTGMQESGDPSW